MLTLGAATIERIVDMDPFRLPLTMIFPDATLGELEDAREWLEPHSMDFAAGEVLLGVQSHLLRIGGLTILVDTCVGECKPRPKRPDWHDRRDTGYLDRLAAAGVRPEEVDVVMCTHLHADHAGWNTRLENGAWVPTFPNARYVMGRAELDHWTAEEARAPGEANHGLFADSVKPVVEAGLAEPVEEGFELTAGLTLRALPGHTPGQMGLELAHPGGTAIFCDLLQQFPPGWFRGWRALVARLDLMTGEKPRVPRKFRLAFTDRLAAREAIERVLSWPAERVLVAHGSPVFKDGQAFLARAFAWLMRA